jgi:glycerol-3-phosphate acyltransferase PlsX
MDPRRANGGVFLGLNGIVIKSHGGTDAEGFAAAIDLGHGVMRDELLAKIRAALARHSKPRPQQIAQVVSGILGGAAS